MTREMDFPLTTEAPPIATHRPPRLLQLGCGGRPHPAWINLDLRPLPPGVRRHDVTAPLPFPDRHFDAVYHAHLLEHLPRDRAPAFAAECYRVLRPGGVLRVVVPDLEQIARLYLQALEGACSGDTAARRRYPWAVLELYDQAVRERPGGAMLDYLARATDRPGDVAWYRLGADGRVIRQHLETAPPPGGREPRWWRRLASLLRGGWREALFRRLLGREYELLQLGRFRRAGEVHQWMYDRHSLRELLAAAGFVDFRLTAADDSDIPGWRDRPLDTRPDGRPAKPDSLYAEARRP